MDKRKVREAEERQREVSPSSFYPSSSLCAVYQHKVISRGYYMRNEREGEELWIGRCMDG